MLLRSVYLSIPLHSNQELTGEVKCERCLKQESSNGAKCDRCSRYATPIVIAFSYMAYLYYTLTLSLIEIRRIWRFMWWILFDPDCTRSLSLNQHGQQKQTARYVIDRLSTNDDNKSRRNSNIFQFLTDNNLCACFFGICLCDYIESQLAEDYIVFHKSTSPCIFWKMQRTEKGRKKTTN